MLKYFVKKSHTLGLIFGILYPMMLKMPHLLKTFKSRYLNIPLISNVYYYNLLFLLLIL